MSRTAAFFLAFGILGTTHAHAQCFDHISHNVGTAVVAGTSVTVAPIAFHYYFADCGGTSGPYLCGDVDGPGGWLFTFNPPVDSVTLDFSALHKETGAYEEIMRVFVNGAHYAIPAASTTPNSCLDFLGELTSQGDVGANELGSSGWAGTTVPGPITELMVTDSMPLGSAGGAFCSVFICSSPLAVAQAALQAAVELYPNPATTHVAVRNNSAAAAQVSITDASGAAVPLAPVRVAAGTEHRMDIDGLAPGHYMVRVATPGGAVVKKLVVVPK